MFYFNPLFIRLAIIYYSNLEKIYLLRKQLKIPEKCGSFKSSLYSSLVSICVAKICILLAVEVALRWVVQSGVAVSVRPTSDFALGRGPQRAGILIRAGIKERANVYKWKLTDQE